MSDEIENLRTALEVSTGATQLLAEAYVKIRFALGLGTDEKSVRDALGVAEVLATLGKLRDHDNAERTLLQQLAEHTMCSSLKCCTAQHYVALSDAAKKLYLSRRSCTLCDGFRRLPNRMDAPNGPVCGCGRPSAHQDGSCGVEHGPVPCPVCVQPDVVEIEEPRRPEAIVLHVHENTDPNLSCFFCGGGRDHVPRPYAFRRYTAPSGSAVAGIHKDCYERACITLPPVAPSSPEEP
jgi:hypothetical protein